MYKIYFDDFYTETTLTRFRSMAIRRLDTAGRTRLLKTKQKKNKNYNKKKK